MLHLWLEVKWSPTIEDDFLSDLDLPAVELVVGASKRGRHSKWGREGRGRHSRWGRGGEGPTQQVGGREGTDPDFN